MEGPEGSMRRSVWWVSVIAGCSDYGFVTGDDIHFRRGGPVGGDPLTQVVASPPGADLVPPASVANDSSWCWFVAPDNGGLGLYVAGMDSGVIEHTGTY